MTDTIERLVLQVNQGCPRGFGFTLQQRVYQEDTDTYNIVPVDITGLTIRVMIKMAPYAKLPALIDKEITEDSEADVGLITDPINGKFTLQINEEDSNKLKPGEYALIVQLVDQDTYTHLSGDGNNYAIYRVCYQ